MNYKTRHRKSKSPHTPLGPILDYQIESITHDAKGISRKNGKVTFIAGALPNETVKARVSKSNRRYDEALLTNIETTSEHRVEPACRHYKSCGGCSFQHLAYDEQITAKMSWVTNQFRKLNYPQNIEQLIGEPYRYRRRARLAVKVSKNGAVSFGFRAKHSSDIVDVSSCVVLTDSLNNLLPMVKKTLSNVENPHSIGHIELLEDDIGCSLLLRLTMSLTSSDQLLWESVAQESNLALYLQSAKSQSVTCKPELMREYQIEGLGIHYHPQAFIQVNSEMNKKMVAQAISWLELAPEDKVLDLFCGVGNFTLPIATHVDSVVGIEVQEQMVESARQNAIANKLENVTFIGADLSKAIDHKLLGKGFTKILLDPPRAGAIEFLPSLVKLNAKTILYVSCDAATLARDAEVLVNHGYQVMRVSMMEMFPQTSHVETMMLLQK